MVSKIDYGGSVGMRSIGGIEIGPDPDRPAKENEISKGGNSGSIWLVAKNGKATDVMVGLHFAGESEGSDDEHALACYAHSVFQKLRHFLQRAGRRPTGALRSGQGSGERV